MQRNILRKSKDSEIAKLIKKVNESYISSIKDVILQLIFVINNPKSSAKDLCAIIETDPPLTANILKLANSAYYGYQREINVVQEAIVAIGFNTVKELALTQKVCELFKSDERIHNYSRIDLWKNSVATALFNKLIYVKEYGEIGEKAYTAGLLRNLGLIVEDQFLHLKFETIIEKADKNHTNVIDEEKECLGFNHNDIGKAVTEDWQFPDELVLAISHHHTGISLENVHARFVNTLFIADHTCQRKEIGFCDAAINSHDLYQQYLNELEINEHAIELIHEDVKAELKRMEVSGWLQ